MRSRIEKKKRPNSSKALLATGDGRNRERITPEKKVLSLMEQSPPGSGRPPGRGGKYTRIGEKGSGSSEGVHKKDQRGWRKERSRIRRILFQNKHGHGFSGRMEKRGGGRKQGFLP